MFRRIGITFGVYGDKDAAERLIPFDIVPRLISRAEWRRLEAGLTQRVDALNLFLKDVYGPRAILKEADRPARTDLAQSLLSAGDDRPPRAHDIWVHIAGIDIVRVDDEEFYVLEDNARTPSGVSYMLENREVTMRLLPDLFARHRVAPVDDYPDAAARLPALGRAAAGSRRGDDRDLDAGAVQFRLLRALVPRRQARRRTGRGPRPVRRRRSVVHAHDAGAAPGRCDLPPRRR